jgi:FkbM family methyltransferase
MFLPKNAKIEGVIQIGANDGNEIREFQVITDNLIMFEPVPEPREILLRRSLDSTIKNIFIFDYVVCQTNGLSEFFFAKESGNSSILDLNPNRPAFNLERCEHSHKGLIESITLDKFFFIYKDFFRDLKFNLLFMDVQGAEHLVILGGKETLKKIKYIWMEVSYVEIYTGTLLYKNLIKLCNKFGFNLIYHKKSDWDESQGDVLLVNQFYSE